MANENTDYLKLPLPHPDNLLEGDVHRLRDALTGVDEFAKNTDLRVTEAEQGLACKADAAATDNALHTLGQRVEQVAGGVPTLSDAVNSAASNVAASSLAVKTAYDKGVEGVNAAATAQGTANAAKTVTDTVSATPAANRIPCSGADGKLAPGWVAVPATYKLCEFYYFRHPSLRPGFQPAQGGIITNAATLYPKAWAYLQTAEGQQLCTTESQWQAMVNAVWHVNADGSRVGWNGIGGAPYYVINTGNGTLRLPDLRGMYAEAAGYDALGVGGVHGDGIRNIPASLLGRVVAEVTATGAFRVTPQTPGSQGGSAWSTCAVYFEPSRVVPVANKIQPRAWGSLACVYLDVPAS